MPEEPKYDLEAMRHDRVARRSFLTAMAAAGLGLAAERLLGTRSAMAGETAQTEAVAATEPGVPTDGAAQFESLPGVSLNIKVLNFALTLEFLEADLYRQALNMASGLTIAVPLNANPNAYKRAVDGGGLASAERDAGYLYLKQFAYVEAAHRDFLNAALGSAAVKRNTRGYRLPAAANTISGLLNAILPLEETGVRAYLGALPYLNDLGLAQTAGTIFSTEARHSAAIAKILGKDPGPVKQPGDLAVSPTPAGAGTAEFYLKPKTVLAAASKFFV